MPSGTKWATCNVGADTPAADGLLFQCGRVEGYKYGDKVTGLELLGIYDGEKEELVYHESLKDYIDKNILKNNEIIVTIYNIKGVYE